VPGILVPIAEEISFPGQVHVAREVQIRFPAVASSSLNVDFLIDTAGKLGGNYELTPSYRVGGTGGRHFVDNNFTGSIGRLWVLLCQR
jgi:hypothetical protein